MNLDLRHRSDQVRVVDTHWKEPGYGAAAFGNREALGRNVVEDLQALCLEFAGGNRIHD
jgi:hypothetical protein